MAKKKDDNSEGGCGCMIGFFVWCGAGWLIHEHVENYMTGVVITGILGVVIGVTALLYDGVKAEEKKKTAAQNESLQPSEPQSAPKAKSKQSSKSPSSQDTEVLTAHCRIAGISFRCTEADEGGFMGGVRLEPDNDHDPNAIAVYTNEGKHVGYVPKDKQAEVRAAMNGDDAAPCVGYIGTFGGRKKKNGVYGKIKIINTEDKNLMNIEAITFVAHVMNDEDEYAIPKEFASEPVTGEEWHKLIGRCHGMPWDDDFD